MSGDRTLVAPLREAFQESGLSLVEVNRRLGVTNPRTKTTALRRTLGLAPQWSPYTKSYSLPPATWMDYMRAVKLACALGVAPIDVGL